MLKELSHQAVFVLLIVTGSMLLTLTVIEVTLRLFPGLLALEIQKFIRATPEDFGVSHPYIGHLHKPNDAFIQSGRDFRAVHHTDGFGFRNAWPWPKTADIVVLGDSLTFGQGVEDEQAWPAIIARSLPGSRVINFGLIGAGPEQYLRTYETFGTKMNPKVLLVGLFAANDFIDAGNFERWLKSGVGGNYMVWLHLGRFGFSLQDPIATIRSTLRRHSYLANLVKYVYKTWDWSKPKILSFADHTQIQLKPSQLAYLTEGARPDRLEFQLVLRALQRIHSIAKQHGTHTLVVLLPSKEEVYLPLLGEAAPDPAGPLQEELKKLGIAYSDLGPAFRERAAKGEKLFFEVDDHPNARGYTLIAKLVLTYLKENARRYGLKE